MQISPSIPLLQALSGIFQPPNPASQPQRVPPVQPADAQTGGRGGADTQQQPRFQASAIPDRLEKPPPGTPVRRGMLVDILA